MTLFSFSTSTINTGKLVFKSPTYFSTKDGERCCQGFLCASAGSLQNQPFSFNSCSLSADLQSNKLFCPAKPLYLNNSRKGSSCYSLDVQGSSAIPTDQKFQLDDVIESQQFDRDILNDIFEVAREMENIEKNSPGSKILRGYLMATLFYEPSTRTRLSFESAMKRLGGEVLTTENAREFSSAAKGETLEG